jgi:hypothetical protein
MSSPKVLFGFHAVGVRLKTAPQSIIEIYYEARAAMRACASFSSVPRRPVRV